MSFVNYLHFYFSLVYYGADVDKFAYYMKKKGLATLGWGVVTEAGAEVWDANPTLVGSTVRFGDRIKLLFYPKKLLLYRWIGASKKQENKKTKKQESEKLTPFRILDVGCGTGAAMIDMQKLFGPQVEIVGIDVVQLQIDLAKEKLARYHVSAKVAWYDGVHIPFPDAYFDAIYSSDVLGHVSEVSAWLAEVSRVVKPGGVLAMFSESALGSHAWIRRYLVRHGVNVDPHAPFHISLFPKAELRQRVTQAGFAVSRMYAGIWPSFFLYPEDGHGQLQSSKKFPILRVVNDLCFRLKKAGHPFTTAGVELYSLLEMVTLGRVIDSQGYVVLARKPRRVVGAPIQTSGQKNNKTLEH